MLKRISSSCVKSAGLPPLTSSSSPTSASLLDKIFNRGNNLDERHVWAEALRLYKSRAADGQHRKLAHKMRSLRCKILQVAVMLMMLASVQMGADSDDCGCGQRG